ncbi:TATA box-binding protein-associated factor RNA polymerase I subunit A [Genypterus blacodes]|uniref:TATA box-binding protein-associated factor RNA polymerase I subunit A n=1 Tax=Genypterus blacodes TaxID=154954 RepID=UPI003F759FB6
MDDLEGDPRPPREPDEDDSSDSDTVWQKSRLRLAHSILNSEKSSKSGFHKSTRVCLQQIKEAMLHHRWQKAAEYMASCPQMLEDNYKGSPENNEIIWRLGIEILHHHPNAKMADYTNIYERMKHLGVRHYLMISLEHAFHLLLNGQIEEAKHQLSVAESWRYGKESGRQFQKTKLIQAYRSLLDYIIWCDKKVTHSNTGNPEGDDQDMQNYFRQASLNLKDILKNPGIWDPFVLSYVEMLEFYEEQEEALNVLNNYAYNDTFPPNPNAHVFLFQYLKRHTASERRLTKVLTVLHALVPSHELMLEYCSLLLRSEKSDDLQRALGVALDMLDFACWRSNVDVWNYLKAIIDKLKFQEDWMEVVSVKMAARKDWWPALHFTRFHAVRDCEENPKLLEVKSSLLRILYPDQMLNYIAGNVINRKQT